MSNPPAGTVRVRFAPSPTGLLHIGGLRTALYNYLFARKHHGQFILRIEDTDQERFVAEAEQDIHTELAWAGLFYDEGPDKGGNFAPYHQSERKALYQTHAQQLLDAGHAYYAFDTKEEIDDMRRRLEKSGNPSPGYNAISRMSMTNSLTLPKEEVERRLAAGAPYVVRLKVPRRETVRFEDLVRGWVSFDTDGIDDQVLIKSDGLPTYHLANVVDDHLMQVTHVIRGEEWLPSTPKHILMYSFFGWTPPQMAHLPLIMSPTGGKLSKRNAEKMGIPVSVRQYRAAGYEPAALLNFLAFLGWNPGDEREVFTLDELVEAFSIERVGSSGVQFNLDKLKWYNTQLIRRMPVETLADAARLHLDAAGFSVEPDYLLAVAELMQERITFIVDLIETGRYFFEDPTAYDEKALKRWKAESSTFVTALADQLAQFEGDFTPESARQALHDFAEVHEIGLGKIMFPTRLALTGMRGGPDLPGLMALIGRTACMRRLRYAATALAPVS